MPCKNILSSDQVSPLVDSIAISDQLVVLKINVSPVQLIMVICYNARKHCRHTQGFEGFIL